ncbi:MAG: tRNA 4-thiouridine(8) synthase ThiI [Clostridia bacterium]|nr:tRNA 4-thiouridine(8) synthase ThiI [Clostridia bacterium]
MKEILLLKYGEIVLKGLNKRDFERLMLKELEKRLATVGNYKVSSAQSTAYVEPATEDDRIDPALEICRTVFGFTTIARAAVAEKNMDDILRTASEYLPDKLAGYGTFKCDARRSDKRFPLTSPEISSLVGGVILEKLPRLKVDIKRPEIVVMTEIREEHAYIHAGSVPGAGGMPTASNGRAMLLLSGGIDSPVAGFMMAKRGVTVEAVHFESFPYTSEEARDKVVELGRLVARYSGKMKLHVISLTKLQETLMRSCDEDYFTILLRRSMMRLAERTMEAEYCRALITGESVGQVASQTMAALAATDSAVSCPVFRPCIGMDKEEIIAIARKIGTFGTSILPYEDCCTVFTPRHPKTRPEIAKVLAEEEKYDHKALEDEAFSTLYTVIIDAYGDESFDPKRDTEVNTK